MVAVVHPLKLLAVVDPLKLLAMLNPLQLVANQWRSTKDVIKWFNCLPNKAHRKFVKFDVKEFYPSIDAKLLRKAIDYARSVCPDEDVEII